MNYLLLGGGGFIGQHLASNLIDQGHKAVVIDNCATSRWPSIFSDFYPSDIQYCTDLDHLVEQSDYVYFLAGSVGVKNVVENPYETMHNNLSLALCVIDKLRKYNKPITFSSSSEVYGEGPFIEHFPLCLNPPNNLRWGYASAKLSTEFLLTSSGLDYKICRFFNITGPGQLPDYGMVLPRFIDAAKHNKDIVVYDSGIQARSFCHVLDAIDMIRKLENSPNGVYNVGNDQPITILDLARRVKLLLNSKSEIKSKPINEAYAKSTTDIKKRIPNLDKIKSTIAYQIKFDLDDLIKDMARD